MKEIKFYLFIVILQQQKKQRIKNNILRNDIKHYSQMK